MTLCLRRLVDVGGVAPGCTNGVNRTGVTPLESPHQRPILPGSWHLQTYRNSVLECGVSRSAERRWTRRVSSLSCGPSLSIPSRGSWASRPVSEHYHHVMKTPLSPPVSPGELFKLTTKVPKHHVWFILKSRSRCRTFLLSSPPILPGLMSPAEVSPAYPTLLPQPTRWRLESLGRRELLSVWPQCTVILLYDRSSVRATWSRGDYSKTYCKTDKYIYGVFFCFKYKYIPNNR